MNQHNRFARRQQCAKLGAIESYTGVGATTVNELSTGALLLVILAMVLMSAYFACSETAMMALNRYRLRHLVNAGHRGARKANHLLQRPDRLLGVILLGNNLVNFIAAAFATVIGQRLLGENLGPPVSAVVFTVFVLIFADVMPKTIAAQRAETLAFPSSYLLQPLLKICQPLVVLINAIANYLAAPMIARGKTDTDELSADELRTVVNERTTLPRDRQNMLLGILDLENATIDDIMVPRSAVEGININDDAAEIVHAIRSSEHTRLPVYRENINDVVGILHLRRAARFLSQGLLNQEEFTKAHLIQETEEPYFVPAGTPLHTQLIHFQKERQRVGLVVDEYGEVEGLVTLEDILEEIVGEFTTDIAADLVDLRQEQDGSYIIEGKAVLRDINRSLGWELPTAGPRTLNGLIVEHLEFIPETNVCLRIDRYRIETLQIADNVVRSVKVWEMPSVATA